MLLLVLPLCFFLFDAVVFLTLSKHTSTATYWLLKATYYTIIQIIITSRPPSSPLKKSRASTTVQNIPKYWKRVMITTLCTIIAVVYLNVVWQLAGMVSALDKKRRKGIVYMNTSMEEGIDKGKDGDHGLPPIF
ncbi:hypothetical protein L484_021859 [Morus notabilis]|uniref:Uncharacterized protein n=1 Tax=Morus notabilis TaxID=981085 RepID=W9R3Y1_9ROSA|nr:hypothetical protein L484_021859 [Morus notabilis]